MSHHKVVAFKPRAVGPNWPPAVVRRYAREEAVGQLLFEYYPHATFECLDLAMQHARERLATGASLDDAMRAALAVIDPDHALSQRHEDAIAVYTQSLNAWRERLQEIAERRICKLLATRGAPTPPADYAAAIARARRVLDGGGTLPAAVYEAVKLFFDSHEHDVARS